MDHPFIIALREMSEMMLSVTRLGYAAYMVMTTMMRGLASAASCYPTNIKVLVMLSHTLDLSSITSATACCFLLHHHIPILCATQRTYIQSFPNDASVQRLSYILPTKSQLLQRKIDLLFHPFFEHDETDCRCITIGNFGRWKTKRWYK